MMDHIRSQEEIFHLYFSFRVTVYVLGLARAKSSGSLPPCILPALLLMTYNKVTNCTKAL